MQKSEVAKLLVWAAGADRREPNELSVEVWAELVGHLDFGQALAAVREHYRSESRPIYPADLLALYQPPSVAMPDEELRVAGLLASRRGIGMEEYLERRDEAGWVDSMLRGIDE